MGTLSASSSSADLIASAAAVREQAALDAFDGLSRVATIGRTELAQALLQVHESAISSSVPQAGKTAVATPSQGLGAVEEFLTLRGENGRPADFTAFVELYNQYIDHIWQPSPLGKRHVATDLAVDTDEESDATPHLRRPPTDRAHKQSVMDGVGDQRVRDMASRMSQARSELRAADSPLAERSGRAGPNPGTGRMTLVSSNRACNATPRMAPRARVVGWTPAASLRMPVPFSHARLCCR